MHILWVKKLKEIIATVKPLKLPSFLVRVESGIPCRHLWDPGFVGSLELEHEQPTRRTSCHLHASQRDDKGTSDGKSIGCVSGPKETPFPHTQLDKRQPSSGMCGAKVLSTKGPTSFFLLKGEEGKREMAVCSAY